MVGDRLRGIRSELTDESMRPATLVGLAAVPAGFLWIYLFGTGSASVLLLAGVLVGAIYSDRPTPAYRAGARAGIFAPIPEAVVQTASGTLDVWATAASVETKVAVTALAGAFVLATFWVLGAAFCIVVAAVTAWIVDLVGPFLPFVVDTGDR